MTSFTRFINHSLNKIENSLDNEVPQIFRGGGGDLIEFYLPLIFHIFQSLFTKTDSNLFLAVRQYAKLYPYQTYVNL